MQTTYPKRVLSIWHWLGLLFLYLLMFGAAFGQSAPTYTDWVKVNQIYVQIKVSKEGVYRIPASLVAQHFPNLSSLNAAGFQLIRRGAEQSIFVFTGSDNALDNNDYIDFYGRMNDPGLETEMYQKPMVARNEVRSVYDDTASYFLTYSPALDGKRVANPGLNNNSSVPFETYHWRRAANFFYDQYSLGKGLRGNVTFSSYFTPGEGWTARAASLNFGDQLVENSFIHAPVRNIFNLFQGGPEPIVEILETGRQPVNHKVEIFAGQAQQSLGSFEFTGLTNYLWRQNFSPALIQNGTLNLWAAPRLTANVAVAYAQVDYPATFQVPNGFSGFEFWLNPNPSNYSRIRFDNLGQIPELYDVTDPMQPIRLGVGFLGGQYLAGVNGTQERRRLFIQNQAQILSAAQVEKVQFTNFNPTFFDYLIVTHPKLRKPVGAVSDPVQAYADYRTSVSGGGHKVLVLEMKEVYQRFGYGERNPMAIRNLCGFFVQRQSIPKALFLIGKGLTVRSRFQTGYSDINLIPTFGVPASDNAFTVGLGEPGRTIAFPVGRLAATTPQHVLTYLNKVKETEAFAYDDLWKKNVLHISGGLTPLEQSAFTNIMNNELRNRIQGPYMGANVKIFNKSSNQTIEYIDIRALLNSGLSLINMFGHSSRTSPDVEIGNASDPTQGFNNAGKYPLMIVNGCFTGNIYETSGSLNEDWIFTPNKGAVLFWAATDEGLSALLRRHVNDFYANAFQDSTLFGQPMGQIQKATMRKYLSTLSSEPQLDSAFMHQFTLHGDPMLRIFAASKPDYKTSNAEVFLATVNPNASQSSLKIGVIASNFGRTTLDSVQIRINRRYSDGQTQDFIFQVKPIAYLDTFYFDLPQNQAFTYSGNNRFEVALDFLNSVDEMNETNNTGFFEYFVPASGILPLFPKAYAVVPSRNVRLVVQATDFLSPDRRYIFQIDTAATFSSPLFSQSPEILSGNVCSWNYLLPIDRDSTVFFWRVRFADQKSPSDTTWYHMSFEYIRNSPNAWAQSHFYQFRQSVEEGLEKNFPKRRWDFPSKTSRIDAKVSGGSKQGPLDWQLSFDGIPVLKGSVGTSDCYNPGYPRIAAVVFDKCDLKPKFWNYTNDPIGYYYAGCGRLPFSVNIFENNPSFNTLAVYFPSLITSFMETGDYLLLFPLDSMNMTAFRNAANAVLPYVGVDPAALSGLQNGNPFVVFGRKTDGASPGQAQILLPENSNVPPNRQSLTFNKIITSACVSGWISSTSIGPSSGWNTLYRRFSQGEDAGSDQTYLQLIGQRLDGSDTVLVKRIDAFPYDLSSIPASEFPYLKLRASVKDTAFFTPSILKRWMVSFESVPEGVLNTSVIPVSEYKVADKQEGDSLGFRFAYTNISNKAFPQNLRVRFFLNGQLADTLELNPLAPDSTVRFSYPKFSTIGRTGQNQLLAFVNPRIQVEEYYENNAINIPFRVQADQFQPILDVTFDGVKIMNGDYVSAQPLIGISLKDENKFLFKSDTSGMVLLLTRPCAGCSPERIPLNSPQVRYFPAGNDNQFRIEYKPDRLDNGIYRLAVQGADVKGNRAGSNFYEVEFNVLDKNTITNFFPYPNPFSTSCQWVFTLTGQIPSDFKIQIMTVTGKVIREITKSELGPLRIGNNISTYRWDATDTYGDRLANGVYLYRVVMKDGNDFVQKETAADHTFTRGFGKLYIIR